LPIVTRCELIHGLHEKQKKQEGMRRKLTWLENGVVLASPSF